MFTVHNFRPFVKNDIERLAPEKEDVKKEKNIIINPLKLLFLLLTGKTNASCNLGLFLLISCRWRIFFALVWIFICQLNVRSFGNTSPLVLCSYHYKYLFFTVSHTKQII